MSTAKNKPAINKVKGAGKTVKKIVKDLREIGNRLFKKNAEFIIQPKISIMKGGCHAC